MKYIHGFLSKRLKEVGVSHDESLVIRYLLNFINSNRMEKILVEGEFYYWVEIPDSGVFYSFRIKRISMMILNGIYDNIYRI